MCNGCTGGEERGERRWADVVEEEVPLKEEEGEAVGSKRREKRREEALTNRETRGRKREGVTPSAAAAKK